MRRIYFVQIVSGTKNNDPYPYCLSIFVYIYNNHLEIIIYFEKSVIISFLQKLILMFPSKHCPLPIPPFL